MVFFAALVLVVTVIGGLTPALYATGVDLNIYLKSGDDVKRRFLSFSLRELLVGLQLGLKLALLTGVGLLVSSMMFHVDIPIRRSSRDMVVVQAEYPIAPGARYMAREATIGRVLLFQELQHNLDTMPEVASVGIFRPMPFSAEAVRAGQNFSIVYKTPRGEQERVSARTIEGHASPEGFDMLSFPLIV